MPASIGLRFPVVTVSAVGSVKTVEHFLGVLILRTFFKALVGAIVRLHQPAFVCRGGKRRFAASRH
jgi:hypothetical protein